MTKKKETNGFRLGPYVVTDNTFRARNRTYYLRELEMTRIRRPIFIFALAILLLMGGFSYSFADLIYEHEYPWLLGPPLVACLIASRIAVLNLRIRTQRNDDCLIGGFGALKKVRTAIDDALERRLDESGEVTRRDPSFAED